MSLTNPPSKYREKRPQNVVGAVRWIGENIGKPPFVERRKLTWSIKVAYQVPASSAKKIAAKLEKQFPEHRTRLISYNKHSNTASVRLLISKY